MHFIFQNFLISRMFNQTKHFFEIKIFSNIIHVFIVTFNQFNGSLMNESIFFSPYLYF